MRSSYEDTGSARSFHLLEESMCVIGETGCVRPYATAVELHACLGPKLAIRESAGRPVDDFPLGECVNVWTVQRGRPAAGLDITGFVTARFPDGDAVTVAELNRRREEFCSGRTAEPPPPDEDARLHLDRDAVTARLPSLEAPLAVPGDEGLTVRLDGARPAPGILSYVQDLVDELGEEERPAWAERLDYGSPFRL